MDKAKYLIGLIIAHIERCIVKALKPYELREWILLFIIWFCLELKYFTND